MGLDATKTMFTPLEVHEINIMIANKTGVQPVLQMENNFFDQSIQTRDIDTRFGIIRTTGGCWCHMTPEIPTRGE